MKKAFHLAKANIRKQKRAVISLFAILLLVPLIGTIGLSVLLGVRKNYEEGSERRNGLHSLIIMTKEMYKTSFEDIIRDDLHVTEYEISEVVHVDSLRMTYGGEIEQRAMILNADAGLKISASIITERDETIPREAAAYLPAYAKNLGFQTGDPFFFSYRNQPMELTVAGFFEGSEFSLPNGTGLQFFVSGECFDALKQQMGSAVWIAVRFGNFYDSTAFNEYFRSQIDVEITPFGVESVIISIADLFFGSLFVPITIITAIILAFALMITAILLVITRFRVSNGIADSMFAIGVLKASGYTGRQIIAGYLMEYGVIALPAALLGVLFSIPVFLPVRQVLAGISGFSWTLGANIPAGLAAAVLTVAILLVMVLLSCRKIHKLPPVAALRGGTAANSFRHNFLPLHQGSGNIQLRLGLKNTMAFMKPYVMIGTVLAAASFVLIIIAALYQNFVFDNTAVVRMLGEESADVELTVARHTDADVLTAELERLPEVRKTSMIDSFGLRIADMDVNAFASADYDRMETMNCYEGRFPRYKNEIAISGMMAQKLGKEIGDSVKVEANKVSQSYIISGYFSSISNGGMIAAVTLEGYRRLDQNYRQSSIKVYFNEGVSFNGFSELMKANYGVVNVYRQAENDRYIAAKARAEEKIANYLEFYDIDSVEYAVIYNGEIILSGSSGLYSIERIINEKERYNAQTAVFSNIISTVTQVVAVISLGIIALILSMTVHQIVFKRRREFGILKAAGFTAGQLSRQLMVSFLPFSVFGVLLGCAGGTLLVNPVMTTLFSITGVHNANIHIYPAIAALLGVLILLFTFLVLNLSAMKIKYITVYELITE